MGVPAHRLRHYEEAGLIRPHRSDKGYRMYSDEDVERARAIRELFDVGFSAKDAALMMPCITGGNTGTVECALTRERLESRLVDLRRRRETLERTEHALAAWLTPELENDRGDA